MKKFVLPAVVAVAAVVGGFMMTSSSAAPDVKFTALDGKTFQTTDLKGKVVLVKFWATSCVTCIAQMPDTIKYYDTYHDKGYETVAVAMSYDPPDFVKNYTADKKLPFTVVLDRDGSAAKAFDDIKFTPVSFLLDRQGNIVKRYIGNYDKQDFIKTLENTLAQN
ncbi:thioredoxin [Advenella kashmirensis W13003]|uniref:Thioredoxin n=1 Tax=Advenella kashmirensis W13003 TaxID=1424334 RepID=V8QT54_9BURK|nr:TlpA disulfide reductase family protein [Advenella kashmirensis]ETF03126.1 thioredoxin [Advenella kashmirensis W13003]